MFKEERKKKKTRKKKKKEWACVAGVLKTHESAWRVGAMNQDVCVC